MASVQKYLNPLILNQKQFMQPVYISARNLILARILFLWNRPASLGLSAQVGPPAPSPFLLPSAEMMPPSTACSTVHLLPSPRAMEAGFEPLPHGLHSPLIGRSR
jgi:hypothetical protein